MAIKIIPDNQDLFDKLENYQKINLYGLKNPWSSVYEEDDGFGLYQDLPNYGFSGYIEFIKDVSWAWYKNGLLHRENNKQAVQYGEAKYWYLCEKLHRTNGPALIDNNKLKVWFLFGKQVSAMNVFELLTPEQKEKAIWELDQWK